MRSTRSIVIAAAALGSLVVAAPARADIFATVEAHEEGVFLMKTNVTTGATAALPDAVRTPGDELHPALSPDRKRLVFLARKSGTVRVVMVDLATGQSADLFNAFEAASDPPNSPTFSFDGTKVITGRRLEHRDPSTPADARQASYTQTDVSSFPAGPFPKAIVAVGGLDSTSEGRTLQPTAIDAGHVAIGIEHFAVGDPPGRITVQAADGTTTLSDPSVPLGVPTVSRSAGVVVYNRGSSEAKLVFRPLAGIATATTMELPALVNAFGMRTLLPAFSRDGRYLAFMRRGVSGGLTRLFVWDTATQLLLRPDGVAAKSPLEADGAIALDVRPILVGTLIRGGLVSFSLTSATQVGIIVQRIVGTTRVLGNKAPKLRFVGRVPLGSFKKGHGHHVRWDRRVNGRKLPPGRYLVTVRSVTRKGQVRDLGKPVHVRIR